MDKFTAGAKVHTQTNAQTIEAALNREIEEETGVKKLGTNEFFTTVISNHQIPYKNIMLGLVLMIYKVKIPKSSKIKLSEEHTDYEWVDKKEAAKRLAQKYPPEFTGLLK